MPAIRSRNTPAGEAVIFAEFGSYQAFNDFLERVIARFCKEILKVNLEPGEKVKVEANTVHTSLDIDITIGITLWKGPSWPTDIKLGHMELDAIKWMTDELLQDTFTRHEAITTQSQVMAFV